MNVVSYHYYLLTVTESYRAFGRFLKLFRGFSRLCSGFFQCFSSTAARARAQQHQHERTTATARAQLHEHSSSTSVLSDDVKLGRPLRSCRIALSNRRIFLCSIESRVLLSRIVADLLVRNNEPEREPSTRIEFVFLCASLFFRGFFFVHRFFFFQQALRTT